MSRPLPVQGFDIETFRLKLEGLAGPERYGAFRALWRSWCFGDVTQSCQDAVAVLVILCPELTAVRGTVVMTDPPDGDRRPWTHWWAVTGFGDIVDPTAEQFPSPIEYTPVDESKGDPTGRCPNCAGLCYESRYLCSDKCEREYTAYLDNSVKGW